jgi:hypothetical protein
MQGKEKALQSQNITRPSKEQDKDSHKTELLKNYLSSLKLHPPVREHYSIAKSFGVAFYKPIFRADAVRRFIKATYFEPTTAATVSKSTGITHKYLCLLKRQLEKSEHVKVVGFGKCPTTFNQGVQFLSSNKNNWNNNYPKSKQINLFE